MRELSEKQRARKKRLGETMRKLSGKLRAEEIRSVKRITYGAFMKAEGRRERIGFGIGYENEAAFRKADAGSEEIGEENKGAFRKAQGRREGIGD